jgi:hypothetical protein
MIWRKSDYRSPAKTALNSRKIQEKNAEGLGGQSPGSLGIILAMTLEFT